MRKNITFAIVATIMGLAMIAWAKSSMVTTHAEVIRPKAGVVALCRHVQLVPANPAHRLLIG
jgi:hypothetical protein